jgi:hypothetical protein
MIDLLALLIIAILIEGSLWRWLTCVGLKRKIQSDKANLTKMYLFEIQYLLFFCDEFLDFINAVVCNSNVIGCKSLKIH